MKRVIQVGTTVSREVLQLCGITAGSGFACAEMKVVIYGWWAWGLKLFRTIIPTLFVDDDLAAEQIGPHKQIEKDSDPATAYIST